MNTEFEVIATGDFLECLKMLNKKHCNALVGPQGGVVILNNRNCVTYQDGSNIYFSVHDYLGNWTAVNRPEYTSYVPIVTDPTWEHPRELD